MMKSGFFNQVFLCLLAGTFTTFSLIAADAPGGPPTQAPGRPGASPGSPGGAGPGMRTGMLTDQQRDLMREAYNKHRDDMMKLDEKMRQAQKELTKAIIVSPQDEKVLRQKAEALSKLQVEQTILRAKIFETVAPTLTPEQKDQIESNPWSMQMLMMGGFSGGARPPVGGGGPPR